MLRTQISLTVEERRLLDDEALRTGRSISALIRSAVSQVYGPVTKPEDDIEKINRSVGVWADRASDGAEYVERLRSGRRMRSSAE